MKPNFDITISELKNISDSVLNILSESCGVDKQDLSFKTSLNNDLKIQEQDWEEIFIKCEEKFKVDLSNLNYSDYFHDQYESGKLNMIGFYLFPVKFILYSATVLFNKPFAKKAISFPPHPKKKPITVGDLITSAVEKRFVKRETRTFKLIPN